MTDHRALAAEIHQSNIAAGWWPENRNRGEVMMLIVSELAETHTGAMDGLDDDKLPHLPMFDVELADTAIHLYDLIGADAPDAQFDEDLVRTGAPLLAHMATDSALMIIVGTVAAAMEGHRKGDMRRYGANLWEALLAVYALAQARHVNLDDVIAQKLAFNATRADHKIENRMAEGGKKY